MKVFAAVLVGVLAVISTTLAQGTWVDPDAERGAKVAGYVACIGTCLQDGVTNPANGPCHLYYPDYKQCLATVVVSYPICVNKCTGWKPTTEVANSTVAAASLEDYDEQEAFELNYF